MKIEMLDYDFTVCKVKNYTQTDLDAPFCFIGKTDGESSLVCITDKVPAKHDRLVRTVGKRFAWLQRLRSL